MLEVLDQARLLVVTGKGGTGKTTVAAGLAVAAAGRGRRVLVAEVEGRQGLAGLFGREVLDHTEVRVAEGVSALAIDPDESLREYLARYGFAPLARLLSWAHLNRFITAAAPGLGDVLLVGKVWEAATREARPGSGAYDLVVLDAPPTGRVVPFLRAPETVAELARVGPIRHQADRVRDLLDDPGQDRGAAHLPARGAAGDRDPRGGGGAPGGRAAGGGRGRQPGHRRPAGRAGRAAGRAGQGPAPLAAAAAAAGAKLDPEALGTLVGEARDRQRQVTRERRLLKELRAGLDGLPVVELPFLADGAGGPVEVRVLAGQLVGATSAGGGLWTAASNRSGRRLPSRSGAPASRGAGDAHPHPEAHPEAQPEAGEAGG